MADPVRPLMIADYGATMQFERRNQTGKAGERALATFVEETLNHIYRQVGDPDIGIDGEIETLAADRSSSGGLIKV